MHQTTQPTSKCASTTVRNCPRKSSNPRGPIGDLRKPPGQCYANLRNYQYECGFGLVSFLKPSPAALSVRDVPTPPLCTINAVTLGQTVPHVTICTIRNIRAPSTRIPVRIVCKGKQINAQALLDSRAEGLFCNTTFTTKHRIPLQTLQTPIYLRNVDGPINAHGAIRQTASLQVQMGTKHTEELCFLVTNTGAHDLLLGTDWLKKHNPNIDWNKNVLNLNRCPPECYKTQDSSITLELATLLPMEEWEPQVDDYFDTASGNTDTLTLMNAHQGKYLDMAEQGPLIAKTTVSTSLAIAQQKPLAEIPQEFRQYHKVFSDEESQRLPKHQPWDHKIDFLPNTQMRKTGVYRLTPPEMKALRKYLDTGLQQGTLRPSESPIACSFFFIDKKDGQLRPVVDYRPANEITRKNAAPIPLIPELIDKLLGARFFTKLDVCWGYNNIQIREGDEWKTAFKTLLGLYESLVMTFGLCNAPATFQTFMDTQFVDLIATGHVIIYLDDILIFATTMNELTRYTHQVLQLSRLRQEVAPATIINKPIISRSITLKQYRSPKLEKPVPQVRSYSQAVKLGLKSHDTRGHLLESRDPSRAQSHDPSRDTLEPSRSRDPSRRSTCLGDHKTVKQPGGKNSPKQYGNSPRNSP